MVNSSTFFEGQSEDPPGDEAQILLGHTLDGVLAKLHLLTRFLREINVLGQLLLLLNAHDLPRLTPLDSEGVDHLPEAGVDQSNRPLHDDEIILVPANKRIPNHNREQ